MPEDGATDIAQHGIAAVERGALAGKAGGMLSVGVLEQALLAAFPAADAEPWDRTGLLVGDARAKVTLVAVALDPNVAAVQAAARVGANVLLTHHPVFLDPPASVVVGTPGAQGPGTAVFAAVSSGVALMNFHTALDVSAAAQSVLPGMLGLAFRRVLDPLASDPGKGYGQLCDVRAADGPMTLRILAARCVSVFGAIPRVWGDAERRVHTVVTCTGSASGLWKLCVAAGVDCLVCGELHYHDALAAADAGLAVVEVGHDVSEIPLCAVLAAALRKAGVPADAVKILDGTGNWWTPETTRK